MGGFGASALLGSLRLASDQWSPRRAYAYVTCGDNQWNLDSLPVDSRATVEAIFDFLSSTFQMKRVYWRGEQDRMWLQHHQIRSAFLYDYFVNWLGYLHNQVKINDVAVAAAHFRGMEIYIFDGLFDLGATADTSGDGMYPYIHEDHLRIEHPEWVAVDRWGERRCPGPIDFCYPAARKALISRYLNSVTQYGYDGIFFYTYVENCGSRYLDEYGFNEPIVAEYERRYGIDIRKQQFNKEAWYRLRGEYMTEFVRELHAALAANGKKLSIAIYPPTPNYPEPWDGSKTDVPQSGMIYMDWEGWVAQGIVDELFVWWRGDQKSILRRMQTVCAGKSVELTVAAAKPFDSEWQSFVDAGATPVGVWAPRYGLDRVTAEPSKMEALTNPDWRCRMQALADIEAGSLRVDASFVAALTSDSHVLVRRHAMFALKTLQAHAHIPLLEAALTDKESSVRIAAAVALAKVNRPETPQRILAALAMDSQFQMRLACIEALAAMKERAFPAILQSLEGATPVLREVCIRVLGAQAPHCVPYSPRKPEPVPCEHVADDNIQKAQAALLAIFKNEKNDLLLYHTIGALVGYRSTEVITAFSSSLRNQPPKIQIWIIQALAEMASTMSPNQLEDMLPTFTAIFREFGDDSKRPDVAWGWRVVGNAMIECGANATKILEALRTQRQDRWLAWLAYQVLYVPQSPEKVTLCDETAAVETHAQYAPPFPGRRI